MNPLLVQRLALMLALVLATGGGMADDPVAELELDQALAAQLRQGKLVWLDVPGRKVAAVQTPGSGRVPRRGGLILLHDRGRNPDWPGLMRPLRTGLARAGWESLAVQMPMTAVDAPGAMLDTDRKQALARITAAVAWFKAHKILNLALIGHGLGAAYALDYLESIQARSGQDAATPITVPRITALVMLGASLPEPWRARLLAGLETLETPILDLYGSRDHTTVQDQAVVRLAAARRADKGHYQQYRMPLAGHDFEKLQRPLGLRLRGWLDRVAPATGVLTDKDTDPEQAP